MTAAEHAQAAAEEFVMISAFMAEAVDTTLADFAAANGVAPDLLRDALTGDNE